MRRILLAMIVSVSAGAASAQPLVLVEKPPTYRNGETFQGVALGEFGTEFRLRQQAQRQPGKKVRLITRVEDKDGNVYAMINFDPETWRGQAVTTTGKTEIISTTCSSRSLYPIFLGKVYECTGRVRTDGVTGAVRTRFEFNTLQHDQQGRTIGYCAVVDDEDELLTRQTSQMCFSRDGKWITYLRIID